MKQIVSFGAGVNSTALLIGLWEKSVRPDVILFADTGGEKPETYRHIDAMQTWLESHGFPLIDVCREPKTLEADCLERETLPGKAFGFGSCSEHFKVRTQKRFVQQFRPSPIRWLVGIHAGEASRRWMGASSFGDDVTYPLIDWGWSQSECEDAILRHGLELPVKSACFFCPSMKKREVLQLSVDHPELMARALDMEDAAIEAGTLETVRGLGRSWSWRAMLEADDKQRKLFADDQSPLCEMCIT